MNLSSNWTRPIRLWVKLKPNAREMRKKPTPAEALLWERLRGHRVLGFKFRRQHSVGRFVVDFCCPRAKLAIEFDGAIHRERIQEDRQRDQYLESRGYRVLRFDNETVETKPDWVVERITEVLRTK